MKTKFALLALVLTSVTAHANETDSISGSAFQGLCAESVHPVSNGFLLNRPQIALAKDAAFVSQRNYFDNSVSIQRLTADTKTTFVTMPDEVRDLKIFELSLLVLNSYSLSAYEVATGKLIGKIATHTPPADYPQHSRASEMVIIGTNAYIAHGEVGVVVVDLKSMTVVKSDSLGLDQQSGGHISKTAGIATNGSELFVMADSVTMGTPDSFAFNGVLRVEPTSLKVISHSPSDLSNTVMSEVLSTQVVGADLLVNNWGTLQRVAITSLIDGKKLQPRFVAQRATYNGQQYLAELLGDVVIDGSTLTACGKLANDDVANHVPHRVGVTIRNQYSSQISTQLH